MPRSPAPPAAAPADPVGDFETAMQELEATVQALERGELKLEDSLARFERGIALARQCRGALQNAELKVQQLLAGEPDESP